MKDPLLSARYFMSETDFSRLPVSEAEVTFVGRSNVGKSSLICGLCQNKTLARVSKTPGRTQGINVYETARGRWLVDLPGYGYAEASQKQRDYWPEMIRRYLGGRPNLKMVFVLIDAERGMGPMDMEMLNWLHDAGAPACIVGTKVDRVGSSRWADSRAALAGSVGLASNDIHWVSAKKSDGIKALRQEVLSALGF